MALNLNIKPSSVNIFSKTLSIYDLKHNSDVFRLSYNFSKYLKLSNKKMYEVCIASLYHDIGKAYIPELILNKKSSLTKIEFNIIKQHPKYSCFIMHRLGIENNICEIVLHHHEAYNGSGYPDSLKGNDIPFLSRLLCITDNYDALISVRPYKKSYNKNDAILIMKKDSYKFDLQLLELFFNFIESKK